MPQTAPDESAERIYITEAAELLNRRSDTIRKWERNGELPQHLRPHRGFRNWRYFTPDQIEGIRQWIKDTDRYIGKGLPHYNPRVAEVEKKLDATLEKLRRPRKKPHE